MKFDEQYEKLLNKYTLNEGIGDTLRKTFVDPFVDLNPWLSDEQKGAVKNKRKVDAKNNLTGDSDPNNKQSQTGSSKYIESYKQTQLKSTITYNKEISFIDRGTVLGQFKFNCNDFITRKININNMLLSNATVAPNLYQQALQFLASYDLRRLRIIDSQVEKDIANAIRPALLKDKLDPANVANKTTEIINELKKYIDSIFAPINLQTQQSYIYEKAAWYFILAKYHQLKS